MESVKSNLGSKLHYLSYIGGSYPTCKAQLTRVRLSGLHCKIRVKKKAGSAGAIEKRAHVGGLLELLEGAGLHDDSILMWLQPGGGMLRSDSIELDTTEPVEPD